MSASQMSAAIRAKKKKMEEDESGAVKLSGIPEDATDEMVIKNKEEGEKLSTNKPVDSHPDNSGSAEEKAPDPEVSDEERAKKNAKHSKIKSMMGRMANV